MLSLTSCPLFDRVTELITDKKGSRAIGFLVMEPYKLEMDDELKNITKWVSFDTETAGMEKTFKEGIQEAAGKNPWDTFWYEKREPLTEFYKHVFLDEPEQARIKEYLAAYIDELQKKEATKTCEVLIYTVIVTTPSNPKYCIVMSYCYDRAQHKMAHLDRSIKRKQGEKDILFLEEMGSLVTDLCEKLYGKASP